MKKVATIASVAAPLLTSATLAAAELSPGKYDIVEDRSKARFAVSGLTGTIRTEMTFVGGEIGVAPDGTIDEAIATLDARSATGKGPVASRLQGKSGFDVANHPRITFVSTGVSANGESMTIRGRLTLKGVTDNIELTGQVVKASPKRLSLLFTGRIDRTRFNVTAGRPLYGKEAEVQMRVIARKPGGGGGQDDD